MATTAIWDVGDRLDRVLNYVMNGKKTEEQYFVSGLNCSPDVALEEMRRTKRQYGKTDSTLAYHGYQSFAKGETTPEEAHAIGVRLAKELWGDRFQVVVSTHLDKGHLHNHFVLNSVSFVDGLRYRDTKTNYGKMRLTSDRLCHEHNLSVIENPQKGVSMHYAEWKASKENRGTWRGLVRDDVDKAISLSMTFSRFLTILDELGYEIKTGVKYMAVRPPGKERFVRLKTLGANYTEDAIKERILGQRTVQRRRPTVAYTYKRIKVRGYLQRAKGMKGFRALYMHYLYKMGVLPKSRAPRKAHFLLREDIRRMEQISEEVRLLCTHSIDTPQQLAEYMAGVELQMEPLYTERKTLYKRIRKCGDAGLQQAYKDRIAELSKQLATHRKDLQRAGSILTRTAQMAEKLARVQEDEFKKKKERDEHEPGRRSR